MNIDMNQYLIFRHASTVVRKITAYQLCCPGLTRSPFVLTEHISSLFIYLFIMYVRAVFPPGLLIRFGKAFPVLWGAGKLCNLVTIANGYYSGKRLLCRFQFLETGAFY